MNIETSERPNTEKVLNVLKNLRINVVNEEYDLQSKIAEELIKAKIPYKKEFYLGSRNRVDFYIDGIVIEVKKGKPNKRNVINQLERYTSFENVVAIILVVETSLNIPSEINSKKCVSFGLNKLWGIAL